MSIENLLIKAGYRVATNRFGTRYFRRQYGDMWSSLSSNQFDLWTEEEIAEHIKCMEAKVIHKIINKFG